MAFFTEVKGSQTPWQKHHGISPSDLFWQMGKGEECLNEFDKFFDTLSDKEKDIYRLINPEPEDWKNNFY